MVQLVWLPCAGGLQLGHGTNGAAHKWGTWFRMSLQLVRAAMFRQAVTVERTMITQDMTHVYLNQKKVGTKTLSFIAAQAALREPVLKTTEGVKTGVHVRNAR